MNRPNPPLSGRRPRLVAVALLAGLAAACKPTAPPSTDSGISPKMMADAVHAVLEADRAIYTKHVVNRLANELAVIKASERWKDDKALPLPAQMFRMGAELAAQKVRGLNYALVSKWPINRQNSPRTAAETTGLSFVNENAGQNYYADEDLGGEKYFTAVYPDTAVAPACVDCHNQHKDSPRHDFVLGDVMGAVVVRITRPK